MVSGHGATVRYFMGTDVNTPIFPSPTLKVGHSAVARVQGLDLDLGD